MAKKHLALRLVVPAIPALLGAGFRAFHISGELHGDLRAQQREMTHVNPVDPKEKVVP